MANIQDATVVASAYDTSGNGGRKLVRLSNGWLVAALKTGTGIIFRKSTDNGTTWTQLTSTSSNTGDVSLVAFGTKVGVFRGHSTTSVYYTTLDAVNDVWINDTGASLDNAQTALGNVSLAINDTGTELHATWSSKNATYPNSFNVRYAKGTINADGSVTWDAVTQVTSFNGSSSLNIYNPSIVVNQSGYPVILVEYTFASPYAIWAYVYNGSTWGTQNTVYSVSTYTQTNPSAIFVPQSINGLANGRIHVTWIGKDGAETTTDNIRYAYSDDGGVTWSAMTKLTTGTTSSSNPSINATRTNDIFIAYSRVYNTGNGYSNIRYFKNTGGVWSGSTNLTPGTTENAVYPANLFDLSISATVPLLIYKNTTSPKVGFYGTWTVTTISVTPGSIGNKTDKSNLLTYSITTDGTMSTITEKVNGVTIGTKTATSSQSLIAGLTQTQWDAVKFGKYADATGGANTLTVEMGSEKWTYTFDKRLATDADILSAVKAAQDSQTTYLPAVKAKLGGAIRGKGGTVNDTDSWDTMANAISGMTNKKWASGTATSTVGTSIVLNEGNSSFTAYLVTVSGLSFTPKIIIVELATGNYPVFTYNEYTSVIQPSGFFNGTWVRPGNTDFQSIRMNTSNMVIGASNFTIPVSNASTSYKWYAIE